VLASYDHDEHPYLRAVVAMVDGCIVAKRYYNGETADALHDIRRVELSVKLPDDGTPRRETACFSPLESARR
jgi:hypothetical protein